MTKILRRSGVFNLGSAGGDVAETVLDADFDSVSLLLDGSSVTDDLSSKNLTITNTGSVSVTSTDPGSHPYATSFLDYGTSGSPRKLDATSNDFAFGTGALTVEGWVYINSLKSWNNLLGTRQSTSGDASGFTIGVDANGSIVVYSSAYLLQSANGTVSAGSWFHFAWVRDGSSSSTLFINGTSVATNTNLTTDFTRTKLGIGNFPVTTASSEQFYGEMADIRVTKGVARYSSSFNRPTSALSADVSGITGSDDVVLLLDGSSATNDASGGSNNVTNYNNGATITEVTGPYNYTQEVISFDGTNDYLEDTIVALGTDDWTIETWVKFDNFNDNYSRIWEIGYYNASGGFRLNQDNATKKFFIQDVNPGNSSTGTTVLSVDVWYHLAVTRSGDVFSFYINGSLEDSFTSSGYNITATNFRIGAGFTASGDNTPNNYTAGDYVDFRITKGAALYPFHPPISALPTTDTVAGATRPTRKWGGLVGRNIAVTTETVLDADFDSVVLLLNGDGTSGSTTFIDQSSSHHTITANGDAQVDTAVKKFGTGSIEFDGTGDYLTGPTSTDFAFGSGDFTIESWVYFTGFDTFGNSIVDTRQTGNVGILLEGSAAISGQYYFRAYNPTSGHFITSSQALSTNTWYHVALVRNGDNYKIFVDGVSTASVSNSVSLTGQDLTIGASFDYRNNSGTAQFTGYLDDLRITKGVARYTGNFTPPTSALTNTVSGGTVEMRLDGTTENDQSGNNNHATLTGSSATANDTTVSDPYGGSTGSYALDGSVSGNYLDTPSITFGTNDFTIETWVYFDSLTPDASFNYQTLFSQGYNASGCIVLQTGNGDGTFILYLGSGTAQITSSIACSAGRWHHIALTRNGNLFTLFVDGVDAGSVTNSININNASNFEIGNTSLYTQYGIDGYIKDFRVTIGTGATIYPDTGRITPIPTSALPTTGTVSTTNVPTTGNLKLSELLQATYSAPVRVSSASVGSRTSTDGTYTFYTFTSTSAQNITFSTEGLVDILLVGGGGGAGDTIGGGGGGGEVIVAKNIKVSAQQYNISVGAGGTAGTRNDGTNDAGNAGSSTTFSGTGFTTLTAVGGGGGGAEVGGVATAGANGGGGAYKGNQTGATGSGTTISAGTHGSSSTYTIYSGNSGGNGYVSGGNNLHEGGGGAGAGSDGDDATQLSGKSGGADGGSGVLVADFDGSYYYGGGGGGASYQYNSPGYGGAGGGGGGGTNSSTINADQGLGDTQGRNNGGNGNAPTGVVTGFWDAFGGAGGANTGGGGGAAGYSGNSAAGAGGSGVVIVRITN